MTCDNFGCMVSGDIVSTLGTLVLKPGFFGRVTPLAGCAINNP